MTVEMPDVITVGSATIDMFVNTGDRLFGKVEDGHIKIPFGSKILVEEMFQSVGGGGVNTASVLTRLGLSTAVLTCVGTDHNAIMILDELRRDGIETDLVLTRKGPSDMSVILDAAGRDRTILTYKRRAGEISVNDLPQSVSARWFYFCTMMGDSLDTQMYLASRSGVSVMYNPSSYILRRCPDSVRALLERTAVVCLNTEEARLLTDVTGVPEMGEAILSMGPEVVIITAGGDGAYCFSGNRGIHIKPHNVTLVEATGAGDSFGAAFLAGYIHSGDLAYAMEWGATEAESVIQYRGSRNRLLDRVEIEAAAAENPHTIKELY